MANVNDIYDTKYLSAKDLAGNEPTVTIESVEVTELQDGKKLEIAFVGKKKHLLANKTNSMRIAYMFGDDTDHWPGKKVQLYTELTTYQGKVTPGIRVRPVKATAPAPAPRKPAAEYGNGQSASKPIPQQIEEQQHDASGGSGFDDEIPF